MFELEQLSRRASETVQDLQQSDCMAASSEGMSPLSPLESLQSELDSQFLDDPEETCALEGAALPESSSGCQKQLWQPEAELAQPQASQLVSHLEATPPPKRAMPLEATPSPQPVQASVSFGGKGDEMPPMPPGGHPHITSTWSCRAASSITCHPPPHRRVVCATMHSAARTACTYAGPGGETERRQSVWGGC